MLKNKIKPTIDIEATDFIADLVRLLGEYEGAAGELRTGILLQMRARVDIFRRDLFQHVPHSGEVLYIDFKNRGDAG